MLVASLNEENEEKYSEIWKFQEFYNLYQKYILKILEQSHLEQF